MNRFPVDLVEPSVEADWLVAANAHGICQLVGVGLASTDGQGPEASSVRQDFHQSSSDQGPRDRSRLPNTEQHYRLRNAAGNSPAGALRGSASAFATMGGAPSVLATVQLCISFPRMLG